MTSDRYGFTFKPRYHSDDGDTVRVYAYLCESDGTIVECRGLADMVSAHKWLTESGATRIEDRKHL